jgi:3-keto-5-aminohexanoate cleavage enzyme
MKPVIISVAPNGARKSKQDIPTLPISAEEIFEEAGRCVEAGATLFHLHVRDNNGGHSLDAERYREVIRKIEAVYGHRLIIQASTETCGIYQPSDQITLVKTLWPPSASIGIRELVPSSAYEEEARLFLQRAVNHGVLIQYICYSANDIDYLGYLLAKGVVPKTPLLFVLFVIGDKTGRKADVSELQPLLNALHDKLAGTPLEWALCAFGDQELPCMLEAVRQGGHVRIGFENNHVLHDGTPAPSTAALVTQFIKALGRESARPVASYEDAKNLLMSRLIISPTI